MGILHPHTRMLGSPIINTSACLLTTDTNACLRIHTLWRPHATHGCRHNVCGHYMPLCTRVTAHHVMQGI